MKANDLRQAKDGFEKLIFNYPEAPGMSYLYLGKIYQKQKLFYEAISLYTQFIKKYPDHQLIPEALIRQGEITFHLGEIQKAKKIFKQVLLQYPQTSQASKAAFCLANCLYKVGDRSVARLYYNEGIKHLPHYLDKHPQTAFNVAKLSMEDKHFDQALSIFLTLGKNYPHLEMTNKVLTFCGDIYVKLGKIPQAVLTYQRVIDNYPKSIGAQVSRIRMADLGVEHPHMVIEHPSSTLQAFHNPILTYRTLIKTTDDLVMAHLAEYKLGLALQKKKKYKEAINTFRSLLSKAPEKRIYQNSLYALKQSLTNYLNQYFQAKDYLQVIRIYEENKDLLDSFWEEEKKQYFTLAQSYQKMGFYPPAIRLYQKAKKNKGDSLRSQINFRLGQIFFKTEEYQKAIDSLKKISSPPSVLWAALSLRGDICREKKDYTGAINYYLAALNIHPSQPGRTERLFKVGQCYQKLGKTSEAIRFLSKAADMAQKEKKPQYFAQIYLNLADSQYKIKQYDKALKTYQALQNLSSLDPQDRDWALFQTANCSLKKAKAKVALKTLEKLKTTNQDHIWSIIADFKELEHN